MSSALREAGVGEGAQVRYLSQLPGLLLPPLTLPSFPLSGFPLSESPVKMTTHGGPIRALGQEPPSVQG